MKSTDYVSGLHYENDTLRFLQHAEGRVRFGAAGARYDYTLRDHLGNTRVLFSDTDSSGCPEALQLNDYYPFGLGHAAATTTQGADYQYLYNGKELQEELGLEWYDYGFRWTDPATARFISVDPLAEKFYYLTTYQYASNSPVWMIDLDGLEGVPAPEVRYNQKVIQEGVSNVAGESHASSSSNDQNVYEHFKEVVKESENPNEGSVYLKGEVKQTFGSRVAGKLKVPPVGGDINIGSLEVSSVTFDSRNENIINPNYIKKDEDVVLSFGYEVEYVVKAGFAAELTVSNDCTNNVKTEAFFGIGPLVYKREINSSSGKSPETIHSISAKWDKTIGFLNVVSRSFEFGYSWKK